MSQEEKTEKRPGRKDETEQKVKEVRYFSCGDCGLHEEYAWFGRSAPFCRSIVFSEESYVARDPFSLSQGNSANFLLLGSNCGLCGGMTCQQCGVFYTKRICAKCYAQVQNQLPQQLKPTKKNSKE